MSGSDVHDCAMLTWTIGVEIELLAPPGRTRADLARAVATRANGAVRRFFHHQVEPSAVPGQTVFENLMPGFAVADAAGAAVAAFVDDLTLQHDLDPHVPPASDWLRLLSDDARLLRLAARHCDPAAGLEDVLEPLAALFGARVETQSGVRRLADSAGQPIALAAPLAGGRERPCEIVTAPLARGHRETLAMLLEEARALGFFAPREGATHLHFDGAALCDARVLARLVETLSEHGESLKARFGVNPHCRRLGPWPNGLLALVRSPTFQMLDWGQARTALQGVGLTKFCDFNLANLVAGDRAKHTFEVRVLPVHLTPEPILAAAAEIELILRDCVSSARAPAIVKPV